MFFKSSTRSFFDRSYNNETLDEPFFPTLEGVEANENKIDKMGSEEITSFDSDITDNSVEIGQTDVLDQELASQKDWTTILVLQKETMVRAML